MSAPTTDFLESLLVGCRELELCLTHACSPGSTTGVAKSSQAFECSHVNYLKATHKASPADQGQGDGGNFSPNKIKAS